MFQNLPVTLLQKRTIAENTIEMTFSVADSSFQFQAGQYVSICIPTLVDASVADRCHDFSIVSSPSYPKEISIAFRVSQSIFKKALLALPVGSVVSMDGPKGVLTLPENKETNLIFVAGGIGITPLLSQIRYATEVSRAQQISLLYCNSKMETAAYQDELPNLKKQNFRFSFHLSLGAPDEKLFAPYIQKSPDSIWYIVGTPQMVATVRQILVGSGILDSQIRIEEFSGYDKQ